MFSIPVTLWSFYHRLSEKLKDEGLELEICSSRGAKVCNWEISQNTTIGGVSRVEMSYSINVISLPAVS